MNKWLTTIIIFAALLRILFLGSHMPSLYGDEISIGYNAYSVLKTGKDEFSKLLPIQFESWGDQKNPAYIYIVLIFERVFGVSAYAVRLPSALSGIAAVYLTYAIVKQLATFFDLNKENDIRSENLALIAAALLAISPWHILVSRGGYEANMALTFGLAGVYFFLCWLKTEKWRHFLLSNFSFVLAMYTYYTTKLFVPMLIVLLWSWGFWITKKFDSKKYIRFTVRYIFLFALLSVPIAYLAIFSNGQARFAKINIFSDPKVSERVIMMRNQSLAPPALNSLLFNKPNIWLRDFLEFYGDNLSASFWYVAGDSSLRYAIGNHGMFYILEAPFFLLGLLVCFKRNRKLFIFLSAWILISIFPTALVGKSYGLRSIALLPIPMIFASYGIVFFLDYFKKAKSESLAIRMLFILFAFSFSNWLVRYIYVYPVYGNYWYDGMQKEAINYARNEENNFDHIFITRYYGKTEMYYAFYSKLDPAEYQHCSQSKVLIAGSEMVQCGKYYFGEINTKNKSFEDLKLPPSSLVIGSPEAAFGNQTILAKDDQRILFKIIK